MGNLVEQARRVHRTLVATLIAGTTALGVEAIAQFPGHATATKAPARTIEATSGTAPFTTTVGRQTSAPSTTGIATAPPVSSAPSSSATTPSGAS